MNATLEEVVQHRNRLRQEIAERQSALAAVEVMYEYLTKSGNAGSIGLASLHSVLAPLGSTASRTEEELAATAPSAPAPAAPPPLPLKPPVHPELLALGPNRTDAALVRWAIGHMTDDFSIHHLQALLTSCGQYLQGPRVSVVVSRLSRRGEIEEVRRGSGTVPTLYRKPENGTPLEPITEGAMPDAPRVRRSNGGSGLKKRSRR